MPSSSRLERRIAEMGGIAEKMVIEAVDALAASNMTLSRQVIATDPTLDALQREIEEQAVRTIARRQPVADDLRELIGAIRIVGDLERVGDLAKSIAKRSIKIGPEATVARAAIGLRHMNNFATELLKMCSTRTPSGMPSGRGRYGTVTPNWMRSKTPCSGIF